MNIMKFETQNYSHSALHIGYKEEYKLETMNTTFLCLQSNNKTNWKNHLEQMIYKSNASCYAVSSKLQSVKTTLSNQFTIYISVLL